MLKSRSTRRGKLGATASVRGFAAIDETKEAPREYLCPITLQLMKDPVLLVETGQVYDRESIEAWFKSGHNTDPNTGVKVRSQRLSTIYPLRSAIQQFANQHNIELDPADSEEDDVKGGDSGSWDLPNPAQCADLQGVSVYDIKGLCRLMSSSEEAESLAAMQLLADMARHGEKRQKRRIVQHCSVEHLKKKLNEGEPRFQVQAARLLLYLPGEEMTVGQMLKLLQYSNPQLTEDVLLLLWQHAYRHRGRMMEIAQAVQDLGADEIITYMKSMADPTQNSDLADEVRAYATFLLACICYKPRPRSYILGGNVVSLLVHYLATTTDVGFRLCLLKAVQYLCEDRASRELIQQAGAVRHFMNHLPPLNRQVLYTARIFNDWFAWVTVPETAVKALYHLSKNDRARHDMRTSGLIPALREMNRTSNVPEKAKSKYVGPLMARLTASQSCFVN
ncbi:unnamed protein product [Ostreobium quekettii]|uniref:RING-type E3 ubiquitin transferase n=1 Tax=Ostreobium quekettii TaxID=121088 RepID=A0A8S1JAQ9_9CHLO|nr:unnamed protein product [Ostreobium quekettii]|eukprot:evm.model.scf_735EXC.4 EVM.evm.TU.scf_735EXC.4   scf_735EXC:15991-18760(+)